MADESEIRNDFPGELGRLPLFGGLAMVMGGMAATAPHKGDLAWLPQPQKKAAL
jgi:hypothetical protein